jgi:hypothetical protein
MLGIDSILRPQHPILLSQLLARRSRPPQPAQQLLHALAGSVQLLPQAEPLSAPCADVGRRSGRGGCGSVQRNSAAPVAVEPVLRIVIVGQSGARLTVALTDVSIGVCIEGRVHLGVGSEVIRSPILSTAL